MNSKVLDPAGHIKIAVSNFKKSKQFYEVLFKFLNWKNIAEKENSAAWVSPDGFGFWVAQAKITEPKHTYTTPGLHHFCFKVNSVDKVNKLYNILKDNTLIFDKPANYPQYTEKYFAVFFADPDGIKLEVAHY